MRIVAALGGNALLERGESPDAGIQEAHVTSAVTALTPVLRHDQLLITHGNGPKSACWRWKARATGHCPIRTPSTRSAHKPRE